MGVVGKLLTNIKRGMLGKNVGIPTGLPKLDKIIHGIQRRYLYTIGADSGGGKTSFALDVFVYNTFKNSKYPVNYLLFSFEMAEEVLLAKLLSIHIRDTYNKTLTFEQILSFEEPLSEEDEKYVTMSNDWLNNISSKMTIVDKQLTPTAIYAITKEWLKNFGEFVQIDEHHEEYIEKDPTAYKIALLDHVGLIQGQGTKKERIDSVVDFYIYFRNKCNLTGVFIQQLNRNAKSMDRKTNGYELVQLDDFKDTSGTIEGSEVVIALFYAYREKIARCEGYPIQNVLKDKFRLIQVLKNRYGRADVNIGSVFFGELGMFKELPKPNDIGDYTPYIQLDYEKEEIVKEKTTFTI